MTADHLRAATAFHELYESRHNPEHFTALVKQIPENQLVPVMFAAVTEYANSIDMCVEFNAESKRLRRQLKAHDD